jgi:hypothetical protein
MIIIIMELFLILALCPQKLALLASSKDSS